MKSFPATSHSRPGLLLEERITIAAAGILNVIILVFVQPIPEWDLFCLNLLIIGIIIGICTFHKFMPQSCVQLFRDWYVPAFLIVIFFENRRLIPLVNPYDLDQAFIGIDRFIFFGHNPTVLLESITFPVISELLQISYASFYLLPFILCLIVYLKKPRMEFHICASMILAGFYLSYLGYYFTPAIGPRFTLDHLQTMPLQGLFLFDTLREVLARAEGRMPDCCPSGHALISLLTVLLAWRHARRFYPIACIWASLVLFSTVYLRYHYVLDIIIGAALSLGVYHLGQKCFPSLIPEKAPPEQQAMRFRLKSENGHGMDL